MTALAILTCLVLLNIFPANGTLQEITAGLVFLLILPILYIKIILRKPLGKFGFSLKNKQHGFFWGGIMLLASLVIGFLLITFSKLKTAYILPPYIMANFWIFLAHELIFANLFLFLSEAFFKGFILFSFAKKFNYWSIAFSFFIYSIIMMLKGNFNWQITPILVLAITGGIVAYKSRSFIYSYLMGLIFMIFFDAYLIYISR